MAAMTTTHERRIGLFAFLLSVVMHFVAPSAMTETVSLSLPLGSQSLDFCPSASNNTLNCDDVACEKSEWDMIPVALAMYKLYWVETGQKQADDRPTKRGRFEVMPPLRRENTIAQIASAVVGLGSAMWDLGVRCGTFSLYSSRSYPTLALAL